MPAKHTKATTTTPHWAALGRSCSSTRTNRTAAASDNVSASARPSLDGNITASRPACGSCTSTQYDASTVTYIAAANFERDVPSRSATCLTRSHLDSPR